MAEERKGEPIEKWNAEISTPDKDTAPVADISHDGDGKAIGDRFTELRESTGMNRKEFAEYLDIPYRTMTEWERGNRIMPNYLYALIEYKIQAEFGLKPEQTKDPNALGNQMRGIEDMVEQNDNSFDGIINNLPKQEDISEKSEGARESVLKKLKDCVKILEEEKDKHPRTLCPDRERC